MLPAMIARHGRFSLPATMSTEVRSRILDVATAIVVLCALTLAGNAAWTRFATKETVRQDTVVADWESVAAGRRMGSAHAPVTIVEFGDYECPACRWFHRSLKAVSREYGDQVAIVYRHFPLESHLMGQTAARAAECAGDQGKFEQYHDMLYTNANWLGLGSRAFESYARLAAVADSIAFAECLYSVEPVSSIEADIAEALRTGATGTPTLVINGRLLGAVPDSAELSALVRRQLEEGR